MSLPRRSDLVRRHRWRAPVGRSGAGGAGNVWTFPTALDNAVWTPSGLTVTPNSGSAPDGSATADMLVESGAAQPHYIERTTPEAQGNEPQSTIVYAKASSFRHELAVRTFDYAGLVSVSRIDLSTGAVLARDPRHTLDVRPMGNGWYYVRTTLDSAGTPSVDAPLVPRWDFHMANGPALSYSASLNATVLLWDVQYFPNDDGSLLAPQFPPSESEANILRFGLLGATPDMIGTGPGGDTATIYRVLQYAPSNTTLAAEIAKADQFDVLLVLKVSGAPGGYRDANGNFDWNAYVSKVSRFKNNPALASAAARRRVVFWIIDEANNANTWHGSISPQDVNDMGLLHKQFWPGCVTLSRMSADQLADGWSNNAGIGTPPPSYVSRVTGQATGGGWTGLDYGWLQFSSQHSPAFATFAAAYADHKARLAAVGLGLIPGLNLWDGGNTTDADGVAACWDYRNDRASSGYIVGESDNVLPKGLEIPCGDSRVKTSTNVVSSPAWIAKCISEVVADADFPFFTLWSHAVVGGAVDDQVFIDLEQRQDYVTRLKLSIGVCNARPLWHGWRPIK